jgi:hypothetical protein
MTDETTGWTGGQRAFGDFAPGLVHSAHLYPALLTRDASRTVEANG